MTDTSKKFNRIAVVRGYDSPLLIQGLRIAFRVERAPYDALGRCQLDIINAHLKDFGQAILTRGERFILEVGYEGAISAIFIGTVQNVSYFRQGADQVTRIWAGDFNEPYEAELNLTVRQPKNLVSLLNSMADHVGIPVVQYEIESVNLQGSVTMTGSLSYELNALARTYGFMWVLKDNALHIVDSLGSSSTIYEVNAGTGLLEPPVLTHKGLNLKMLLEPAIKPSDTLIVNDGGVTFSQSNLEYATVLSEGNTQQQVAYTVIHTGDTHTDVWYTEVEGLAFSGT